MIKKDCRGRTWRSAEIRRKLIEEYRDSEFSVAAFCSARDIHPGTFYSWLAKERKGEVAPVFREVEVTLPATGREVRICLPNRVEVSVPIDSSAELAFVLREAAQC